MTMTTTTMMVMNDDDDNDDDDDDDDKQDKRIRMYHTPCTKGQAPCRRFLEQPTDRSSSVA